MIGHLEAELKDMYKAEGREEGRAEGREEARAEARAEGEIKAKVFSVNKLVANKIFSFEEALKFEELSREDYDRYISDEKHGQKETDVPHY